MTSGAETLVGSLHGQALRRVCASSGQHFQGLSQACRALRLPGRVQKRLRRLDEAFAVMRHITEPFMVSFLDELDTALQNAPEKDFTEQKVKAAGLNLVEEIKAAPGLNLVEEITSEGKKPDAEVDVVDLGGCVPTPPHAGEGTKSTFPAQDEHDVHGVGSVPAKRRKHDLHASRSGAPFPPGSGEHVVAEEAHQVCEQEETDEDEDEDHYGEDGFRITGIESIDNLDAVKKAEWNAELAAHRKSIDDNLASLRKLWPLT